MLVSKRQSEREHASALSVNTVAGLNGSMVHINKHLTVIQADTHTHCSTCKLIVGTVKTLENPVYILLVQPHSGISY